VEDNIGYILGREGRAGVKQLAPGQHAILWTDEAWDSSLATMLCEWLSTPEALQPLYTIFVRGDAGTSRAVLDHRDMRPAFVILVGAIRGPSRGKPLGEVAQTAKALILRN
jgi:hypothetical protein